MGLIESALAIRQESAPAAGGENRYAVGQDYFSDFSPASLSAFRSANGYGYGRDRNREQIENDFAGYVNGIYKADGVVSACMIATQLVFGEARFQFRRMSNGRPGDLFGTSALAVLEEPWPNGSTGEMLARMIADVHLAGNAYIVREGSRLRRRRPDWVQIILSAPPDEAVDSDIEGYAYWPGGIGRGTPKIYLVGEMCHWSPVPDPDAEYRGMAWLTPVVREIAADQAATTHKLSFFRNGAQLGPIFRLGADVSIEKFREFKAAADASHLGPENAYKPLYVGGGADVTLGGADMQQLDYRAIVGAGETRIAAALRVHPVIVGLSEGMQGSSLNAGNYQAAKRNWVDGTIRPLWRSVSASLASVVAVPAGAQLWYDHRDIPYLREDAKDAATIAQSVASTISTYVTAGFEKASVIKAVEANDLSLLVDTGLVSVQLLPPGTTANDSQPPDGAAASRAAGHDVTPGHDQLHHYWTRGEGLAKWVGSPTPWTTLYHHLVKFVNPEMAKRMAAQWFHEVKGYWPGDQKGDNPVGPG